MKNIIKLLILLPFIVACDDLFSPAIENNRDVDAMYEDPGYAQGIIANAYILLPYQGAPESDVATDDAVSNNNNNNYLKMATGSWSANDDPMSQWQGRYNAIQYINLFLENVEKVVWAKDERIRAMFNDRFLGEAYGLRALNLYYLLRSHGGYTEDGRLMGVPIILNYETSDSDFNHERNTYKECVDQIIKDATLAVEYLPLDYKDLEYENEIPSQYISIGVTNPSDYNRVYGGPFRGLMSGRIAKAILAQTALLAASPAYNSESGRTWEDAANYAGNLLNDIGGPSGLDKEGYFWYENADKVTNYGLGGSPAEIIWRGSVGDSNDLEKSNFPPSLYGNGLVNPTQNLVDAFPMENGYPIDNNASEFDGSNPYNNRDPRLSKYIVVNGSKQGPNSSTIISGTYGTTTDVINKESGKSTRTGYYLRKLLRSTSNPDPNFNTTQKHYTARIRYTEIFLIYAEAANEAWGPTVKGSFSFSAYDVVKAIRERAGLGKDNGDSYLESIKSDPDKMRELIHNERRLELCFENFRFWDLRRWKKEINESAKGVEISQDADKKLIYTPINKVEVRNYKDYMYYGPIPYQETLKWSNLIQNKGW